MVQPVFMRRSKIQQFLLHSLRVPTASGGEVTLRPVVPGDLPIATASTAGIVTVPVDSGLRIDGGATGLGSDLTIDNDLVASSDPKLVAYNEKVS